MLNCLFQSFKYRISIFKTSTDVSCNPPGLCEEDNRKDGVPWVRPDRDDQQQTEQVDQVRVEKGEWGWGENIGDDNKSSNDYGDDKEDVLSMLVSNNQKYNMLSYTYENVATISDLMVPLGAKLTDLLKHNIYRH